MAKDQLLHCNLASVLRLFDQVAIGRFIDKLGEGVCMAQFPWVAVDFIGDRLGTFSSWTLKFADRDSRSSSLKVKYRTRAPFGLIREGNESVSNATLKQ